MRLTDGDLRHLFRFGMAMQKLDERDESLWCGIAMPHPENRDWIDLWITDEMNTVLPREVEPDDLGGYIFVDPWGGRRRIFPLPEARRVSFGTWEGTLSEPRRGDDAGLSPATPGSRSNLVEAEHPAPEMAYFLVHYALNGYPWGVWGSPTESYYGDDAHPILVQRGANLVASRDIALGWPEWIDSVSWYPSGTQDRWDLFKSAEAKPLQELLAGLRGGLSYTEWILSHGDV